MDNSPLHDLVLNVMGIFCDNSDLNLLKVCLNADF